MPKQYFMFIPFPRGHALDFKANTNHTNWSNSAQLRVNHEKVFVKIYIGDKDDLLKFDDDGAEVTIYLRGHGSAGLEYLSNSSKPRQEEPRKAIVKLDTVVGGIIAEGLQPNFAGKIKCYNCHSAEDGPELNELSFAAQFASAIRTEGYNSARIFGYRGAINGAYKYKDGIPGNLIDDEDSYYAHKWTVIMGAENTRTLVRTKTLRVQF